MTDVLPTGLPVAVFGEVLLDCFEDGQQVPGGAPFNVAWHLHALGDAPLFISRLGNDSHGERLKAAMQDWHMSISGLQFDAEHATGIVDVRLRDGQPDYVIREDSAWDHIAVAALPVLASPSMLYHGTLALRHENSRAALHRLQAAPGVSIFIDLNLRAPWWNGDAVHTMLQRARWAKMNQAELAALGFDRGNLAADMAALQAEYPIEQLIVTCGEAGARVRSRDGRFVEQASVPAACIVDSVGAGDAFSAMYIHGLRAGWPAEIILGRAQQFASAILGRRGAIVEDPAFYRPFVTTQD